MPLFKLKQVAKFTKIVEVEASTVEEALEKANSDPDLYNESTIDADYEVSFKPYLRKRKKGYHVA